LQYIAAMSAGCPQISSDRPSKPPAQRRAARPIALQLPGLDGRSRETRLIRQIHADLIAHVGGKPSVTQAAIIDQLVQLRVRIATMDREFAETGDTTGHDTKTYLAWANSYARLLRHQGLKGVAERPPSLADHLAARTAPVRGAKP
jgi:hypothetical protein